MQNQPSVKIHYFLEQLHSAHLAARSLQISFERSKEIIKRLKKNPQSELRIEEEEILEAMTSRFARLADLTVFGRIPPPRFVRIRRGMNASPGFLYIS